MTMPYINREDRMQYQPMLLSITALVITNIVEEIADLRFEMRNPTGNSMRIAYLNYAIGSLINKVWGPMDKRRYVDHQDVTGFLTCAAFEYNRRYTKSNVKNGVGVDNGIFSVPLKYQKELDTLIEEAAELIPKDHMLRSGHMNYFVSYMIDSLYGGSHGSNRDMNQHLAIEELLHAMAKEYYDKYTAPYEDKKIAEQGDLRDL